MYTDLAFYYCCELLLNFIVHPMCSSKMNIAVIPRYEGTAGISFKVPTILAQVSELYIVVTCALIFRLLNSFRKVTEQHRSGDLRQYQFKFLVGKNTA